jgi:hypothetical protein
MALNAAKILETVCFRASELPAGKPAGGIAGGALAIFQTSLAETPVSAVNETPPRILQNLGCHGYSQS